MNSAINYYSAAQRHTDAIRDARRNPPLVRPVAPVVEPEARPGLTVLLARRARRLVLRPLGV